MFGLVKKTSALPIFFAVFAFALLTVVQLVAQDAPPSSTLTSSPSSSATPTVTDPTARATTSPTAPPIAYDTQPLPADPAAALLLASKANGLGGEGLKPWYLKAHYQTYDAYGKPSAMGTLNMWWAAKDRYRVTYASPSFTRTTFVTPEGRFQSGATEQIPYAEKQITSEILHPLPASLARLPMKFETKKKSDLPLTCITIVYSPAYLGSDCFDPSRLILRSIADQGSVRLFNTIKIFQHRFVASDIQLLEDEQPVVTIDIDVLRGMQPDDLSSISPTSNAIKKDAPVNPATEESLWLTNPVKLTPGRLISGPEPEYPPAKRGSGAQTVRLLATVGKDGHVTAAEVVRSRDPLFGAAAVKAVSKWKFTPFLRDGQISEAQIYVLATFVDNR